MTFTEVLVVLAVIILLAVIYTAGIPNPNAKDRAQRINCVNNLKEVYLASKIWEGDHNDRFPFAISVTNGGTMELIEKGDLVSTFLIMSNQLVTPKLLFCTTDVRRVAVTWSFFTKSNISYFLNVDATEAYPGMIFMGDRNIVGGTQLADELTIFKSDYSIRWGPDMHHGQGNVSFTDGSVEQTTSSSLAANFTNSITRLAIP